MKNLNKFAVFTALVCIMLIGFSGCVLATERFSVRPETISINKGDSFSLVVYDNDSAMTDATKFTVDIEKVDRDLLHQVYWHYTVIVATDGDTARFTFVTTDTIESGTYTVKIIVGYEVGQTYTTIYVKEKPSINWVLFTILFVMGIVFTIVCGLLWDRARKTKTLADDIAVIFGVVAGVGLLGMAIAILLGYLVI